MHVNLHSYAGWLQVQKAILSRSKVLRKGRQYLFLINLFLHPGRYAAIAKA